jgi:hypothetical protein
VVKARRQRTERDFSASATANVISTTFTLSTTTP